MGGGGEKGQTKGAKTEPTDIFHMVGDTKGDFPRCGVFGSLQSLNCMVQYENIV